MIAGWIGRRLRPALRGVGGLVALALLAPAAPAQTIDTVIVLNSNIFEEGEDEFGFVSRVANALHVKTRQSVIRRTLLLDAGDPYDSARVAESERALRNLNVFRYVLVDTVRVRGRFALVAVTGDGWSTKPTASVSTAGGDAIWELGMVEQNFLGFATTLTFGYRRTPDRDALQFLVYSPSVLFRRAGLVLEFANLSDGHRAGWRYGVPFYQTSAPWSLYLWGEASDETILQFRNGALDTTMTREAFRLGLTGGIALHATSRNYLRLWSQLQWRREDFAPETTAVLPRSEFATLGAGIELGHVRFTLLEHFNSYARREDVNLSQTLRVGLWIAPRAWGYEGERAGVGPEIRGQVSATWHRGFAAMRFHGQGLYASGGLDSGRVRVSVTLADQRLPRQTWVLFAEGALMERPKPGDEFDLWLERRGPRLFGAHAFTGTRMAWGTLENRILIEDDYAGLLGVGIAPFVDWGGAWYADQSSRSGGNVGLSLRLGPSRSARAEAGEIAVGYRFGQGWGSRHWAVAVRKGFVF
jgi:hypothetical protein